jgi:23S rRNA (adenine2503-C2)-methyltransferase
MRKSRLGTLEVVRCMNQQSHRSLFGLDLQELTSLVEESGQPAYRARQLFQAIYRERVKAVEHITTLPKEFRAWVCGQEISLGIPQIDSQFHSNDGTVRYLMRLQDGETIETVWMPEGDGGERGDGSDSEFDSNPGAWHRATICVSSQVGCAVNCQFCLTALLGVKRNLTAGEIVGQVIAVLQERDISPPLDRVNLVFMGMGEPLLNYENFIKSVRLLVEGAGIPQARMTVSTAGIVPRIYDLGQESIRPKLAISLTAANDELRTRLMPINKKWNLESLIAAARAFPLKNREKLTFEYVLLRGVNDSAQHARELAELVRGLRAKINLIPWNSGPELHFQTPENQDIEHFQRILISAGIPAFVRKPRGRDIYAACGQLKRTVELTV